MKVNLVFLDDREIEVSDKGIAEAAATKTDSYRKTNESINILQGA